MQCVLTIARDVTEQRRAEAERSELYQEMVQQQNRVLELLDRLAPEGLPTSGRIVPGSLLAT